MKASFHEIAGAINQANRIAILSHVRPDCDAIGSQLALALSLQQLGKEVSAWNEDGLPESFRFLEKSDFIHRPPGEPEEFDLAIALDTASQQRLGTTLQSDSARQAMDQHRSSRQQSRIRGSGLHRYGCARDRPDRLRISPHRRFSAPTGGSGRDFTPRSPQIPVRSATLTSPLALSKLPPN